MQVSIYSHFLSWEQFCQEKPIWTHLSEQKGPKGQPLERPAWKILRQRPAQKIGTFQMNLARKYSNSSKPVNRSEKSFSRICPIWQAIWLKWDVFFNSCWLKQAINVNVLIISHYSGRGFSTVDSRKRLQRFRDRLRKASLPRHRYRQCKVTLGIFCNYIYRLVQYLE